MVVVRVRHRRFRDVVTDRPAFEITVGRSFPDALPQAWRVRRTLGLNPTRNRQTIKDAVSDLRREIRATAILA